VTDLGVLDGALATLDDLGLVQLDHLSVEHVYQLRVGAAKKDLWRDIARSHLQSGVPASCKQEKKERKSKVS